MDSRIDIKITLTSESHIYSAATSAKMKIRGQITYWEAYFDSCLKVWNQFQTVLWHYTPNTRLKEQGPHSSKFPEPDGRLLRISRKIFLIVDALDEYDIFSISRILDEVSEFQVSENLNFLATSRRYSSHCSCIPAQSCSRDSCGQGRCDKIYQWTRSNLHSCLLSRHPELQQKAMIIHF
jgi:hypothetical protein